MIPFETTLADFVCGTLSSNCLALEFASGILSRRAAASPLSTDMAWLRVADMICGCEAAFPDNDHKVRVAIAPFECALVTSLVLSDRHRSLTFAAIDRSQIHWFDLGRARRRLNVTDEAPWPLCGSIVRRSADESGVEARLGTVALPRLDMEDLFGVDGVDGAGSDTPAGTYPATPLLRWVLKMPGGDAQTDWLGVLLSAVTFRSIGAEHCTALRLACLVTCTWHIVALCRFAACRKIGGIDSFRREVLCAMERVAEWANPCDSADLLDRLAEAKVDTTWMKAAVESSQPLALKHFARALIVGGNGLADFLDWAPTGTVLEATRFAMQHRQCLSLAFLAHTNLPPPLVRLVCELAFSLPDLAAEAIRVPVERPGEVLRTSVYPASSFTDRPAVLFHDDGTPDTRPVVRHAVFTYPDGKAANMRLTISKGGECTLLHNPAEGEASITFVDLRRHNRPPQPYYIEAWWSYHGRTIRNCLDSLFGDTLENRTCFVAERLRETCLLQDDWATRSHRAAYLLARFGTDCMAAAVFHIVNDDDGETPIKFGTMFAGVLALGVSPNHPRLCKLPWHKVKAALAAARSYQAADPLPTSAPCTE